MGEWDASVPDRRVTIDGTKYHVPAPVVSLLLHLSHRRSTALAQQEQLREAVRDGLRSLESGRISEGHELLRAALSRSIKGEAHPPDQGQGGEAERAGIWHKDGPLGQVEAMARWVDGIAEKDPTHRETLDKVARNLRAAAAVLANPVPAQPRNQGERVPVVMCENGHRYPEPDLPCPECGAALERREALLLPQPDKEGES